eukprot:2373998-Amphidinium_carterae.1
MADAWFHSVQIGPEPTLRRAYVDDFMLYVHGESMAEVVRKTSSLHQSLTRWLNEMAVEVNNKTHLAASSEVLLKKLRQADHGSMRDYSNAAEVRDLGVDIQLRGRHRMVTHGDRFQHALAGLKRLWVYNFSKRYAELAVKHIAFTRALWASA